MSKYKSPAPDGTDLQAALASLEQDYALCSSQTVSPLKDGRLQVVTRVWRDVDGVRIGVVVETREWSPAGLPLLSFLLASVHRAYWSASDLAHAGGRKRGTAKIG